MMAAIEIIIIKLFNLRIKCNDIPWSQTINFQDYILRALKLGIVLFQLINSSATQILLIMILSGICQSFSIYLMQFYDRHIMILTLCSGQMFFVMSLSLLMHMSMSLARYTLEISLFFSLLSLPLLKALIYFRNYYLQTNFY